MTKVYICAQMTRDEIIARSQRYLDIVAGAPVYEKVRFHLYATGLSWQVPRLPLSVPAEIAIEPKPFFAELKRRNMEVRYRRING